MNIENLRKLRDTVAIAIEDRIVTVQGEKEAIMFSMAVWEDSNVNQYFDGVATEIYQKNDSASVEDFLKTESLPHCGTIACLGGLCNIMSGHKHEEDTDAARKWLDISEEQAESLFYPKQGISYEDYTAEDAVQALDNLIRGAKNPWEGVRE